MQKIYSEASPDILGKEILPGVLAASLQEPLDLGWIRQIVEHGIDLGLPMSDIYENKRNKAINLRGIAVPSFSELMKNSDKVKKKVSMDFLFD